MLDLKKISLFHGLNDAEISTVATCLREKEFQKGEILYAEGDPCQRVFIVETGRVKVFRMTSSGREQILETLGPGETCACNPGSPSWVCSTSAQAATDCKVWFFSRMDYVRMVQSNLKFTHALNQLFADRLKCFSQLIEEVSLKDTKKRLVKFLLDMHTSKNNGKYPINTLFIPFTRQEIAQRIGAARETVARQLYQLKRQKLIDIKPHQIIIINREGLEKILS